VTRGPTGSTAPSPTAPSSQPHLSEYLATPDAEYIGIRPEDIVEYDLPTDPLSDSDVNALESELEDPRFQTEFWEEQIELQLDIDKKAEQQSLPRAASTS